MSLYYDYAGQNREYGSLTSSRRPSRYPSDMTVTVQPVGLVVDVETVKSGLSDYGLSSDNLISLIVAGVTEQIEKYLGRDLLTRTRKAMFFRPGSSVYLMPVPVASITTVSALDDENTATALTLNEDYYLRGYKDNVELYALDLNGGVRLEVTFVTGYGTASDVPPSIRQAIVQESYRQFKWRQDPTVGSAATVDTLAPETLSLIRSYIVRRP
jgi:uncharacterized phiE125 gp8 family phage protein